ncbi:hypothetical protein UFOVP972_87 [uncultured Caudovirales phage]|uniref:Uncharacterized protein n=1 Tax=uncultured Caudovirales phage TaxID=2100421 RepID=A0A6J5PXK8_9CAUD|nr:hypothetical protein UFOVP972_87 [uncultured Caudovirales phage]
MTQDYLSFRSLQKPYPIKKAGNNPALDKVDPLVSTTDALHLDARYLLTLAR